jgi:hypothetical protein
MQAWRNSQAQHTNTAWSSRLGGLRVDETITVVSMLLGRVPLSHGHRDRLLYRMAIEIGRFT